MRLATARVAIALSLSVCVLAVLCHTARAETGEQQLAAHPQRSLRKAGPLDDNHELDQRAELMFRALDSDGDQMITPEDAAHSPQALSQHLPGVTEEEFQAFVEVADKDGDGALSRDELKSALADGIQQLQDDDGALLETDAATKRTGFLGGVAKFAGNVMNNALGGIKKMARGVTGKVDEREDGCVMCQYIVERCEANVRASGVIPGLTMATAAQGAIFLETEAKTEQLPAGTLGAAAVIGASRQATRYQRQMERQKFNEIYRIVDVTLDDVCEQGMPNRFYKYCKMIYQTQSEVVDGLRYQYRAADICFRTGMCGKKSYITKGVHSRY